MGRFLIFIYITKPILQFFLINNLQINCYDFNVYYQTTNNIHIGIIVLSMIGTSLKVTQLLLKTENMQ